MQVLIVSEQAGVEQVDRLDRLPDVARHDQPLYVLPTAHARQLLADLLAHAPREALRRLAVAVVDEVGQHHVVQHRLASHTGQVRSCNMSPPPTCSSPCLRGQLSSSMPHCVRRLSSRISPSISNLKGSWPKLASIISPGVCSPTVGYSPGGKSRQTKLKNRLFLLFLM